MPSVRDEDRQVPAPGEMFRPGFFIHRGSAEQDQARQFLIGLKRDLGAGHGALRESAEDHGLPFGCEQVPHEPRGDLDPARTGSGHVSELTLFFHVTFEAQPPPPALPAQRTAQWRLREDAPQVGRQLPALFELDPVLGARTVAVKHHQRGRARTTPLDHAQRRRSGPQPQRRCRHKGDERDGRQGAPQHVRPMIAARWKSFDRDARQA